jgi:hypothetical protein
MIFTPEPMPGFLSEPTKIGSEIKATSTPPGEALFLGILFRA